MAGYGKIKKIKIKGGPLSKLNVSKPKRKKKGY